MEDRISPRPRRWAFFVLLTIVGLQLQVLTALPASAAICSAAFTGAPDGTLAISATVPNGGTIQANQSITITITWNTGDWTSLDQFHSCFQLDGVDVNSLNLEQRPPELVNDGIIQHTITVPSTVSDGDELCSRSRLSGQPTGGTSTQKSNKICWTVGSVPQDPDVVVKKSASKSSVKVGDSFDYTLEAENIGNADATNVQITDTLPSSLTVTSKPPNCTGTATITCDLGTLTPGQKRSVTFTVQTSNGSCPRVDNFGTVSASNEPSANKNNNTSSTVTVNVDCTQPDVVVKKSASKSSVTAGDSFDYTLEAENIGNADATNVQITDTLPSSLTVTSKPANCTGTATITCDLGTLAAGAKRSVTFTVKTSDGSCPKVDNFGTVSAGNEPSGNTGNNKSNTVTVNVTCPEPDVLVSKSASTASVNADGSVTFSITATNAGQGTAKDVKITDTLPSSVAITGAPGCSVTGQTVTCAVGDLAGGAKATVQVTVKTSAASCPEITNFALVSASNEPSANTGNNASNTVRVAVVCPDPDVEIRKSSDGPSGGVAPGERFTYTITVENVGGASATGVEISDTIPDGLEIVDASGNCSVSGQGVTCDVGTLAAGAKASVTVTVKATEDACPEVTNRATVSATNEPAGSTGNNTSDPVNDLINCTEPGIAIRIIKTNDANGDGIYTDNEEAKKQGLDVPFKLVITNVGEDAVRVTDLIDSFDRTTVDLLENKCASLDGVVLDPGESVECTFVMRNYSPPQDTVLENNVEVCVKQMGGDKTDCDDDPSRVRSAEVLGRTITKTPPGGTAFTGSNGTLRFGLLAMALLLLGTGIVYAGYRRRQSYDG